MRVNGLYRRYNHNLEIRIGIGNEKTEKTIKIETTNDKEIKSNPQDCGYHHSPLLLQT